MITDVIWTTFHVTQEKDVEKIEKTILEQRDNPLLSPRFSASPEVEK